MARKNKHSKRMQEVAAKMVVVGMVGLLAPFLIHSALLRPVLEGLQPFAWLALVLGAVLAVMGRDGASQPAPRAEAKTAEPLDLPQSQTAVAPSSSPLPTPTYASLPDPLAANKSRTERELELARAKEQASAAKTNVAPGQNAPLWSASVFAEIEWRRFEAVVERLFQYDGFQTKSQSHGADGGVDIWLYSREATDELLSLVQCKHWHKKRTGVAEVHALRGVMASHGVERGQFVSSSGFTTDAQVFAEANGISLMDGAGLLKRIASCTAEQQAELLAVARQGEYWRPTCASCGIKLLERKSRHDGKRFWGCANFPRCKTTISIPRQAA